MGWLKMEEKLEIFEKTDENLEKLKQIGINKIREDTKLDVVKISDILEKRFDKLDYVRARGFINILERQYKLDLSDWLKEYRQHFPEEKNESEEELEKERYKQAVKQKRLTLIIVTSVLFLIFLYVVSQIFWSKKNKQSFSQVQETRYEESVENEGEDLQKEMQQDEEKSQTVVENSNAEQEKALELKQIDKPISQLGTSLFHGFSFDPENVLYLSFQKPVWVGVINLTNKKRITQIKQEFEMALDADLIFYIAYGVFTATVNEDEKQFYTYKPVFLIHTRDGGLKQITKEEFTSLNGGVEW